MASSRTEYTDAGYDVLLEAFGDPSGPGGDGKVLAEWQLTTPHGWAEVYDYKSYVDNPHDVEEWHVQAERDEGFEWVYDQIREAGTRLGARFGGGQGV